MSLALSFKAAVRRLAASETSDVESVMMAIVEVALMQVPTGSRNNRGLAVTCVACDGHLGY